MWRKYYGDCGFEPALGVTYVMLIYALTVIPNNLIRLFGITVRAYINILSIKTVKSSRHLLLNMVCLNGREWLWALRALVLSFNAAWPIKYLPAMLHAYARYT